MHPKRDATSPPMQHLTWQVFWVGNLRDGDNHGNCQQVCIAMHGVRVATKFLQDVAKPGTTLLSSDTTKPPGMERNLVARHKTRAR